MRQKFILKDMKSSLAKKILKKIKRIIIGSNNPFFFKKASFSQSGEDLIVEYIFQVKNIIKPTYIDIGAFHPYRFSNTAVFYKKGCRGVNVEPNPTSLKLFQQKRPKDVNLNIGISTFAGSLDYYQMNISTMNTFDKAGAEDLVLNHGFKIDQIKKVEVKILQHVIEENLKGIFPDFLSIDVEGLDLEILHQIDYTKNFPKVICVETISYTNNGTGKKNQELINFLLSKNYFIYADTFINTIFVNKKFWGI